MYMYIHLDTSSNNKPKRKEGKKESKQTYHIIPTTTRPVSANKGIQELLESFFSACQSR